MLSPFERGYLNSFIKMGAVGAQEALLERFIQGLQRSPKPLESLIEKRTANSGLGKLWDTWHTGYVGLPKGHPWSGKTPNAFGEPLSYASQVHPLTRAKDPNKWWVGFDTRGYKHESLPEVKARLDALKNEAEQSRLLASYTL